MPVKQGSEYEIKIATGESPNDVVAIADLFASDEQSTRQTQRRSVFGSEIAHTTRPPRETTLSIQGLYNPEDEGQAALFAALASEDETVTLHVYYDAENGYVQQFQVNDHGHSAEPNEFQEISFSLTPTGEKTPFSESP